MVSEKKFIARLSYGKDSLKMLDVIFSRKLPLTDIVTTDVWATDDIPADLPEVVDFKRKIDEEIKKRWGYDVKHECAKTLDGKKNTFERLFFTKIKKGQNKGKIYGFPVKNKPYCKSLKILNKTTHDVYYIGLAWNEKKRFKILTENIRAPLVEYHIEEDLCGLFCQYSDFLLPTYEFSYRNGCWFCPFQRIDQMRFIRKRHPNLWKLMLYWDSVSPTHFNSKATLENFDRRFFLEDSGFFSEKKFKWSLVFHGQLASF